MSIRGTADGLKKMDALDRITENFERSSSQDKEKEVKRDEGFGGLDERF